MKQSRKYKRLKRKQIRIKNVIPSRAEWANDAGGEDYSHYDSSIDRQIENMRVGN